MSHYVEAKGQRSKKEKSLHHITILGSEDGNAHIVEHHHEDASIQAHRFEHPSEDEPLLGHLAHHLALQPLPESNEQEGGE